MTTEIYLDGGRLEFEDTAGDSPVRELVELLERELSQLNRCILEVSVDGERVAEWRSDKVLARPLSGCSSLSFTTVPVEKLALDGMDTLREYMGVIRENIVACAMELRMGRPAAGLLMGSVFDGLIEVVRTAEAVAGAGARYGLELFGAGVDRYFGPLAGRLEELDSARTSEDTVAMADILEYEIGPLVTEMEERLFNRRAA